MTTKAQLYLNEQTTEREFAEKLAAMKEVHATYRAIIRAKDAEIEALWTKIRRMITNET